MTLLVAITVALAALAVLAAIVVVAVGGGGELSTEHPDHPPLALPGRAVGGTDAALIRLPLGLWGYHKQITDEALERFAYELTERDTRIAVLEQELAEARLGRDGGMRGLALSPGHEDPPDAGGDPLAIRAVQAFGAPAGEGHPLAGEASAPHEEPGGRKERFSAPGEAGNDVQDEVDDVQDSHPAREDGGR